MAVVLQSFQAKRMVSRSGLRRLRELVCDRIRVEKSKPFAGVGVTNRGHKEAEPEGQHENIQHGLLLCGVIHGAKETPLHWVQK
jgi:hypothetical protein